MEYVTPPHGAVAILNFFACEPDFANIVGDLSEEFELRASAHGHPAAKRWYWREALRNAMVLGKRELLRSPGKILAVSLLTSLLTVVSITLFPLVMVRSVVGWIPHAFWPWYQAVWPILVFMLYAGSGAVASLFVRTRELALVVSFASVVSTLYIILVLYILNHRGAVYESMPLAWLLTIVAYSIGCFWIRWRRLARLPYRVH
jgi:hypothetical protein